MLCPRCMQNEANVFFTRITNGKKEEIKVCSKCAKELGLISQQGVMFNMSDFISDFVGKGLLSGHQSESGHRCPACGTTLEQFAHTSRFGCGECYSAFGDYLDPVMKKFHAATSHVGKLPEKAHKSTIKKRRIDDLKTRLEAAVSEQRFEDAAILRDEIKSLAQEIENDKESEA